MFTNLVPQNLYNFNKKFDNSIILRRLVLQNNTEKVEEFLKNKQNDYFIETTSIGVVFNSVPLIEAVRMKNIDMINLLLKYGANPYCKAFVHTNYFVRPMKLTSPIEEAEKLGLDIFKTKIIK
jgi:ankyrin repeat protein